MQVVKKVLTLINPYSKTFIAPWANCIVLAFFPWKSKQRPTMRTPFIYMCIISPALAVQINFTLKYIHKVQNRLVFPLPGKGIAGHNAKQRINYNHIDNYLQHNRAQKDIDKCQCRTKTEKQEKQRVGTVPAGHKLHNFITEVQIIIPFHLLYIFIICPNLIQIVNRKLKIFVFLDFTMYNY